MGESIMNINQVMENVKDLSFKDRALVAHCLISSLDTRQDEGIEVAWAGLAERRYKELVSGDVDAVSWKDVKRSAKE